MPVKKTSSNVAKSARKGGFKFKWWMAVIGIGVIVGAGALIVQFSHAGQSTYWDGYSKYNTTITKFRSGYKYYKTWGDGACIGTSNAGSWCRAVNANGGPVLYNYNGHLWQVWTRRDQANNDGAPLGSVNACASMGQAGKQKYQYGDSKFPSVGENWYIWEMNCKAFGL